MVINRSWFYVDFRVDEKVRCPDSNLLASFEKRTFCDISKKKHIYSSVFLFVCITCHDEKTSMFYAPIRSRFFPRFVFRAGRYPRLLDVWTVVVISIANKLAEDTCVCRNALHLNIVLARFVLARLVRLVLRVQRCGADVADKAGTWILCSIAALQGKVPVGHVLRWV